MKPTIGADVEVFLSKDDKFVSAYGLLPGTKENPHPLPSGAVQVDGVAAEFNIPPASSLKEFKSSLVHVMSEMIELVPGHLVSPRVVVPVNLNTLPVDAKKMGCSQDYCAYSAQPFDKPNEDSPFRTAGGHIHIGNIFSPEDKAKEQFEKSYRLGRLMDKYVGVPSLTWDKNKKRRQTYGRPGNIRQKSYGVEYRSLSSMWVFDMGLISKVYLGTIKAVRALHRGEDGSDENAKLMLEN